ncbi:amino acid ABC transporter substrate-binding protein, PAAT family [Desulfomicrobium apsheronum]|uniref:Amino acid ABC transporter substrate-binding protein, PAAT family n=1 Tax=Desulfomicrobium apsheronum TaxID=52560 RepID=A0A1I3RLM2_9BACT|nr:transporter substrate-binding domain-containing protein [Desulfomicrobium apsheronum]SFJ46762.1 amino acid ABC transporter substrate-binding protein, PAAT family [Desulfomicrobium apsheronum]
MLKKALMCLGFLLMCMRPQSAIAESLDIYYFEYPPYYHQLANGQASGIIVDLARQVFAAAGVEPKFSFVPAKRILHEIQSGRPAASLGWFKTAEREQFAHFSLPIYVNRPVGVFFLRENEQRFRPYDTLEGLLQNGSFFFGRVQGFSEGALLDEMISKYQDKTVQVAADTIRLLKMLESRRFDFMLIPPEEVDVLLQAAQTSKDKFKLRAMNDIPQGNLRYIIYSKAVDPDLIRRIDQAIVTEIGMLPNGQ